MIDRQLTDMVKHINKIEPKVQFAHEVMIDELITTLWITNQNYKKRIRF